MKLSKKNRGFTLIEVTIALVILGIALIALAGLMASTTRNNASGSQMTEASTFAQDLLERLRVIPLTTLNNTYSADTVHYNPDMPNGDSPLTGATGIVYTRGWSYHPNVVPSTTLDTITVTVTWQDPSKHQDHIITMISSLPL